MKENWEKYTEWFTLVFFNIAIPFSQVLLRTFTTAHPHIYKDISGAQCLARYIHTKPKKVFFLKGGFLDPQKWESIGGS